MLFGSIKYKDYDFEVYCEPKEATLKFYIFPQSVEAFKFVGINAVDRRPYSVKVNKTTIELPLNPEDTPNLPFYKMLGALFNTASLSFLSGENIGTSEEPKYKFKVEPVDYIYKATLGILTEFSAESSDISIKLSSVAETDKLLTELRTGYLYGTSKKTIRYKLSDFAYAKHGLDYSITEAKKKKEKQVKSTQVLPDGYVNIEEFYHTPAEVFNNNKNADYSWLLDRDYVIVTDEDFQATMNYFNQFKMIAMDTETTGLRINQMMHKDPSKADKLVGIILCAEPGKSYYFPIGHEAHFPLHDTTSIDETYDPCIAEPTSIKNLFNGDMQAFIAAMKPLLEEKEYITFNADFDWRVMYGYHVNLNVVFDVYAAFMLTKNAEIGYLTNNLKAWTERALNRKALELDNISKSGTWSKKNAFSFKDLPYELVRLYACADADNTLELYNYLIYNHIVTDLASPELVKLETKFMLAVAYQEFYGHHIDPAELANLKETLTKDAADMLGKFLECLDNKGIAHSNFNIKSSMQLLDVLYSEDKLNIPVQKDPKTGKPTTSAKVLAKLLTPGGPEEQQYPEIYYLDAYRKAAKLLQDFTVFLDDPDFEGYLYSDVKQFLNTGRVAVSNPNYQSYNDEAKKYVTPREGYYMMDYDYSSIESRVIASMAKEPYLIEAFADPDLDYHKLQASKLYNIPYEKVTKKMRKASKALNFGIPYGMSDKELGRIIFGELNERNTNEAKRLKDLYFKVQPNVKKYFAKNKEDGVHKGYTETLFGRRRYYPKNQPEYKRALAAGNAPIQGCVDGKTLVQTKEYGFVQLEDYVNKTVTLWDGTEWTPGTIIASGQKRKCTIHFTDGSTIVCSPDHKFLTVSAKGVEKFKKCSELTSRDHIKLNQHYVASDFKYKSIKPEKHAHNANVVCIEDIAKKSSYGAGVVLGRLASDGTFGARTTGASYITQIIAEHEFDIIPILEQYMAPLKSTTKINAVRENRSQKIAHINVYSTSLANELLELDIKHKIHKNIFMDTELLRGFIAGLFDGDGSIANNANIILTFGTQYNFESMLNDIQKALKFFGIRSTCHYYPQHKCYKLNIKQVDVKRFATDISFINPKKQAKAMSVSTKRPYKAFGACATVIVDSIDIANTYIPMYDVCNTKNGFFVADGLITHNSAADIFKVAVGTIFDAIFYNNLQGKILIPAFVHDECVLEVSKEIHPTQILSLVKVIAEMRKRLEKQGFVPIYIGAGFGNSWYEAKSGEIPLFLQDEMIANPDKFYTNWPEDATNLYKLTMDYVKAHELERAIATITNKENDGKILKAIVYDYILELLADKGLKPISEDMNEVVKQFAEAYNVDTSKVVTFVEAEEPAAQQEDTAVLVGTIEVQVDDLLVNDIQIISDDTTKAVVIKIPDSCLQDQTPVQQFLVANSNLYTNEDGGYQLWYAYKSSGNSYKANQLLGYNIKQDSLITFVQSYKQFIINQQALAKQREMLSYQGG